MQTRDDLDRARDEREAPAGAALASARARLADALRFHPREAVALGVLAVLVVAGGVLAVVRSRPAPAAALAPIEAPSEPAPATELMVHIAGAVRRPGVYTFDAGARVIDAVRAAGGFADGADGFAVNLARALVDGEQILVPRRGESGQPATATAGSGAREDAAVDINTASVADLDALPGIGPVLAQRIVDYREQHGPFRSVRDLLKVPGIGPRKFEAIEELVRV